MRDIAQAKSATSQPEVEACVRDESGTVALKVPQGYDARINIRLLPVRDICEIRSTPPLLDCQPREGSPRRDVQAVPLPESLVDKLRKANEKVIGWLAQDVANAQLFLVQPVEALTSAGVELTRSERKTLDRSHRAVKEATVIAPGVKVVDLSASADPRGHLGEPRPGPEMKEEHNADSISGPEGKE